MKKTTTITIRISLDLVERIKAAADNRNSFIVEAIEEKLNPVKFEQPLTESEKRNALKGAKNLSDIMQDLILQEASRRKNFLNRMDDETFAKLVASRLPKENQNENAMEPEVLSLRECLAMLPDVEDVSRELSRVKGELYKAERERDINLKLLKHHPESECLAELMELVYRSAVEYTVNLIARKNLPGFGDGGGLSSSAYGNIATHIRKELENLKIHRSGK